jgi:selenocysteine lyase/cysteine desulfurase
MRRSRDVKPPGDPEHLDYVALSAHKMYARFGTGALVGRRDTFLYGAPEHPGGGTVEVVTPTDVYWAGLPDREEAGSPNVIGAVAISVAAQTLMDAGMDSTARHEASLTAHALSRLQEVTGLTFYGAGDPRAMDERVGVIAFNVGSVPHGLVAAVLAYEAGIGVRSGCFCAQSYVAHLLGRTPGRPDRWPPEHLAAQRTERPGMVRLSLGVYNTRDEVDALVHMLERITRHDYRGHYRLAAGSGDYTPADYDDAICSRFTLSSR